jgi:hypothetical protein
LGRAARGAALPETTLVLTATLAMFFGIIQIGVIGFLQIMVDGAAFVAAHEYALGNTSTTLSTGYVQTALRLFPLMGTPVIDANAPDATTVDVDYTVNQTTQRHGGVSLIRGTHLQATVTRNAPGGVLGTGVAGLSDVSIHGSAIEPENLVSNSVYDVAAQGYSSTSTLPNFDQSDFYSNVQNAPANYISAHQMAVCTAKAPFPARCPNGSVDVRALGTAEFLDHDNWQRSALGVGTTSAGFTFSEMLCHQQAFAAAALIFVPTITTAAALTALSAIDSPYSKNSTATAVQYNATPIGQIYSWDYPTVKGGGYPVTEKRYGAYPLTPGTGCS